MIGAIYGQNAYYSSYYPSAQGVQSAQNPVHARTASIPAAQPETPVLPVTPAPSVQPRSLSKTAMLSRLENDPVAMSVRGRIQYAENTASSLSPTGEAVSEDASAASNAAVQQAGGTPAAPVAEELADLPGVKDPQADEEEPVDLPGIKDPQADEEEPVDLPGIKDPQETAEEGECETCKKRKYQDGSDDPGVSFKTAAHIDPEQSASVVRGHEMEHVVREQAKARREGREVISQTVTMHTGICPECGTPFISGGTTRTVTKAASEPETQPEDTEGSAA